ncbi:MAG: hypothetical protein ACM3SQ_00175 [Betaproteobacteria bacterium]
MKRLFPFVLAASLAMAGCFQSSTLINVHADGSGTIEQTTTMTAAALAQLKQLAASFGGKNAGAVDPFSEDQQRAAASKMGEGVAFVSSTPIKSDAGEGRRTIYAFRDINTLSLSQQPDVPGGMDAGGAAGRTEKLDFHLTHQPNGDALLRIHFPAPKMPPGTTAPDAPGGAAMAPDAGQLAMMKQMLGGLKISIAVRPIGTLVHTNGAFVENDTVTLLEMDFDRLLANPDAMAKLRQLKTLDGANGALEGIDGLKVNPTRDLDIEFKPAR